MVTVMAYGKQEVVLVTARCPLDCSGEPPDFLREPPDCTEP